MKRIGIFGGTFDPVHLGHRFLAEEAIKAASLDKLYVIPAGIPPHKQSSGMTSDEQRLEMCRLTFSDIENTEVSDFEINKQGKSYSYETVKYFSKLFPDDRLYFVMGSDQLLTFEKWFRYKDILALCNIIALSREDDISQEELENKAKELTDLPNKIITVSVKPLEISSTFIREIIASGGDPSQWLEKKTAEYIITNNLYRNEEKFSMPDKKKYSEYKEYIKEHLSKKRAQHSLNVADAAVKLAKLYGADEDKAYVAGLLHDVCKELPAEEQLAYVLKSPLDVSEIETKTVALFHAVAGSVFVQEKFGIDDPEIIKAIRYHTVGCGNMEMLSKIIYIADLISAERDYKDVKKMRKVAEQGLDKAMLEALKFSITDSVGKENTIPLCTLECYNNMINTKKNKEE
ncbi:MAG: nicotinate-nucleotide adenylyltransferase [Ruminococcus sp.]|nr:nicotinate-nucleotide adenylyltransferase [Ruminococcus sp.]